MPEKPAGGDVKEDPHNLHGGDKSQEPMEGWRMGVGCGHGHFTGKSKCEPWQLRRTILSPLQQSLLPQPHPLYRMGQAHRQGMGQDAEMEEEERTHPGSSAGSEVITDVEAKV